MQLADRADFEDLVKRLCIGFDLPATKHRMDAYWSGLRKMSLHQFERCVDRALEEEGPEDLPRVKDVWKLHRQWEPRPGQEQTSALAPPEADHLDYFANRLLMQHMTHRGGLGSIGRFVPGIKNSGMQDSVASGELTACLKVKRSLVDEFQGYVREGDDMATPAAFIRAWMVLLKRVSKVEPRTLAQWDNWIEDPAANVPVPADMARDLQPEQSKFDGFRNPAEARS
jgi:hypothetical protein